MWYDNRRVFRTFTSHHPDNAYAEIEGVGWLQLEQGNTSGVTNMLMLCAMAQANGGRVKVEVNPATNRILTVYLLHP